MADPALVAVVLTAIPVEYEAVREHLLDVQEQVHPAGTIFHIGRLRNGPWRVVLTRTGQGNQRAATIAERAISYYRPELVMLVGVAGRLHDDLSLGDVVVAKKVYAVHSGKEDSAGFRPRPETLWPDHGHVQRAERIAESGTWQDALPGGSRSGARAVVRAIASGEVVLDSGKSPHARMIKRHYDDAAAIEMEGAGVALASQLNGSLPVVVLRGISDYADGQKEVTDQGGWQRRAARHATAFAVTLLSELASARHANAVSRLVTDFNTTLDPEASCRIIWALGGLGSAVARDALRDLEPRYDIERLVIHDALEVCGNNRDDKEMKSS